MNNKPLNILGLCGSLRTGSFNMMLLKAFGESLPERSSFEIADIGILPPYNFDQENNFPAEAQKLKDKIRNADGIIIATPEYNRSIPGVLKNAIDWTSRPYGDSAWTGKKVLIVGASTGAIGTALAQSHLKQVMLYLDTKIDGQPEFYCGMAPQKFDSNGKLIDQETRKHIEKALERFLQ